MKQAESGMFKTLGDSLRRNPHHLTSNDQEALQLLLSGSCALLAVKLILFSFLLPEL